MTYFIAAVWFINGFFCKVLNLVPRHQEIVYHITKYEAARKLTVLIGVSEVLMAFWVASQFKSKLNAGIQIFVVLLMNVIEFTKVPELLLWGKVNFVFALCLVAAIYYNEFILKKKIQAQP